MTFPASVSLTASRSLPSLRAAPQLTSGVDRDYHRPHNHSVKVQKLFSDIFEVTSHNLIPTDVYAHYIKIPNFVRTGKNGETSSSSPRTGQVRERHLGHAPAPAVQTRHHEQGPAANAP